MSSSSEEDLSKFREVADVDLFYGGVFKASGPSDVTASTSKKSLRYLETPDENRTDLKVTPGFQKHVASRLMQILDDSLESVIEQEKEPLEAVIKEEKLPLDIVIKQEPTSAMHDSNDNCTRSIPPRSTSGGIKLFSASAAFIASCNITPPPPVRRRKRGRKAACISSASEDDSSSNEADTSNPSIKDSPNKCRKLEMEDEADLSQRFAACAVSPEWILNGEATKGWAPSFKNKNPIQGEAVPDLINIVSGKKKKSKHKKEKKKERKKCKEELPPIDILLEAGVKDELAGKGRKVREETEGSRLRKKRGKRGRKCLKNQEQSHLKIKQEDCTDASEFPKKKKKKKKKGKSLQDIELSPQEEAEALIYLKKLKKKKKQQSLGQPMSHSVQEDEGFDSDPMKTDKKIRKKKHSSCDKTEEDLKRRRRKKEMLFMLAKKFKHHQKKKWEKKVECLSGELANLMMSNVKED